MKLHKQAFCEVSDLWLDDNWVPFILIYCETATTGHQVRISETGLPTAKLLKGDTLPPPSIQLLHVILGQAAAGSLGSSLEVWIFETSP